MLRAGAHARQLQKWYDRLAPLADAARERLRGVDAAALARRSGCDLRAPDALSISFMGHAYQVTLPGLIVSAEEGGAEPTPFAEALFLSYLDMADGAPPAGEWIAYHDLPGGMFYAQAFRGYAENRLARACTLPAFCRAARTLVGEPIEIGSAGYAWDVLPRVRLGAVYWEGDEDFPSQASVLFDRAATHYLTTDGLAVLGSRLVDALVRESEKHTP